MYTAAGDLFTNLTVTVTDDETGRAARAAIEAAVRDDGTLTFEYGKYTYSQLMAVYREIDEKYFAAGPVTAISVDQAHNRVTVTVEDTSEGREAAAAIEEQYGAAAQVDFEVRAPVAAASPALSQEQMTGAGVALVLLTVMYLVTRVPRE